MTSTHMANLQLALNRTVLLAVREYRTICRKARYGIVALAAASSFACGGGGGGDGAVTAPPVPPTNLSFNLQQVNGQNLPASFQPADGKLVITSGTMLLRTDRSFTENIFYTFTPTGGSAAADTAVTTGTYLQTGSDVAFTVPPAGSEAGSTFNGTISGNTLTYNDAGFVAVYLR